MGKTLLSILLFFLSIYSYSQRVLITGKVILSEQDSNFDYSSIYILNHNSDKKLFPNSEGIFSINVQEKDVIEFSGFLIDSRKLVITNAMILKGFIQVELDFQMINLNEVMINPLNKNFKANISKEDDKMTINYKSWGLDPKLQYIGVNPYMTSALNSSGLAYLIAKATGRYKKDKKVNDYFIKVSTLDEIKSHFSLNYYLVNLKIPEYKVNEFNNYCAAQTNIVNLFKMNKFEEVEKHLENCAFKYLQLIAPKK